MSDFSTLALAVSPRLCSEVCKCTSTVYSVHKEAALGADFTDLLTHKSLLYGLDIRELIMKVWNNYFIKTLYWVQAVEVISPPPPIRLDVMTVNTSQYKHKSRGWRSGFSHIAQVIARPSTPFLDDVPFITTGPLRKRWKSGPDCTEEPIRTPELLLCKRALKIATWETP